MRFTADIAVHDRNHQNADGEYWAWRSPSLSVAALHALRELIASSDVARAAGAVGENDLCGGLLLQGPRAVAFRFCWGDRDERGRPERIVLATMIFDRSAAKSLDPLTCVDHPALERIGRLAAKGGRLPPAAPGDLTASIDAPDAPPRSALSPAFQANDERGLHVPLESLKQLAAGLSPDHDWMITVTDARAPGSRLASGASIRRLGRSGAALPLAGAPPFQRGKLPSERAPVPDSKRPLLSTSVPTVAAPERRARSFFIAGSSDALSRWLERCGIALAALAVGLVVGALWGRSASTADARTGELGSVRSVTTAGTAEVLPKPAPTAPVGPAYDGPAYEGPECVGPDPVGPEPSPAAERRSEAGADPAATTDKRLWEALRGSRGQEMHRRNLLRGLMMQAQQRRSEIP